LNSLFFEFKVFIDWFAIRLSLIFELKVFNKPITFLRKNSSLRRSILRFFLTTLLLYVVISIVLVVCSLKALGVQFIIATGLIIIAFFSFLFFNVSSLKNKSGKVLLNFGIANVITAVRIFLIPSLGILLFNGFVLTAVILYVVCALMDILDGFLARRSCCESLFGTMIDPVGDILTTSLVFFYLWRMSFVPSWLFGLLIFRYIYFFTGLAILKLLGVKLRLKATIAGKVSAIIYGITITIFLVGRDIFDRNLPDIIFEIQYYLLAFSIIWVIISQSVIGYRMLRERREVY